jgi:hypothetical protein
LDYYLRLYKPQIFHEDIWSSAFGIYWFSYITKPQFIFFKEQNQLKAPWIIVRNHISAVNSNLTYVQNKLDPNFYRHLSATDTAVIQEYTWVYDK